MWPREKGKEVARIALDPRAWDRKAIWQHAVKEPVGALPAAILGLLLNILDALSYGMFNMIRGSTPSKNLQSLGLFIVRL